MNMKLKRIERTEKEKEKGKKNKEENPIESNKRKPYRHCKVKQKHTFGARSIAKRGNNFHHMLLS